MYLTNGAEDCTPVGPAEICWCPETGDCISIGIGIIDHDVRCIVRLDFSGKVLYRMISNRPEAVSYTETYSMDLNMIVHILRLNGE